MIRFGSVAAAALVCATLGGCAVSRYPVMPTWSVADAEAMSCEQLGAALADARGVERQIGRIAAGERGEKPVLYSTARPDADRAVQARIEAITAAMQAKGCVG